MDLLRQEILDIKKRLLEIEKNQSNFAEILSSINRADIDYIAMEADIDLDQEVENA